MVVIDTGVDDCDSKIRIADPDVPRVDGPDVGAGCARIAVHRLAAVEQSPELTEIGIEAGVDDITPDGDVFELKCAPADFNNVRQALTDADLKPESAELSMEASSTVTVEGHNAHKRMKLLEELEEHDDVQNVYGNYEISEAEMERIAQ